ncbi:MAG: hypothetical protein OXG08_08550 [Gammaproteobacteria bacterium]|nr:hypothetical protein [Gammaproteobacteria bacterium]
MDNPERRYRLPYWSYALMGIVCFVASVMLGPMIVRLLLGNSPSIEIASIEIIVEMFGFTLLIGFLVQTFVAAVKQKKQKASSKSHRT